MKQYGIVNIIILTPPPPSALVYFIKNQLSVYLRNVSSMHNNLKFIFNKKKVKNKRADYYYK